MRPREPVPMIVKSLDEIFSHFRTEKIDSLLTTMNEDELINYINRTHAAEIAQNIYEEQKYGHLENC